MLSPGRPAVVGSVQAGADGKDLSISCIMATHGRLDPAGRAIDRFRRQTHPSRELVIACATIDSQIARYVATLRDSRIRVVEAPSAATVGALRNAAILAAHGEWLCVWDDDDLAHPRRLEWQIAAAAGADVAACLLARVMLWWPARRRLAVSGSRMWENSLLVRRSEIGLYPDVARGGDTMLVERLRARCPMVAIDRPIAYCYVAHGGNLWGERHFEMLFEQATETLTGDQYDDALSALAVDAP